MKAPNWKRLLALLIAVSLLAAACGGSDDAEAVIQHRNVQWAMATDWVTDLECTPRMIADDCANSPTFAVLDSCPDDEGTPLVNELTTPITVRGYYLVAAADTDAFRTALGDIDATLDPVANTDQEFFVSVPQDAGAARSLDNLVSDVDFPVHPDVVFFLNQGSYDFRPEGSEPVMRTATEDDPATSSADETRSQQMPVIVLDTDPVDPDDRPADFGTVNYSAGSTNRYDPYPDVYRGHGPAIADLIADRLQLDEAADKREDVILMPIRIEESVLQGAVTHPNGRTRGFDTTALLASLNAIDLDPTEPWVLNLSLSSEGCEELFGESHPIHQWIDAHGNTTVVATAGNNGDDIEPHYPAGWAAMVDNVISVGAVNDSYQYTCFTNWHESVSAYFLGQDVPVDHPVIGPATWDGTSFAAPLASVEIADGQAKTDLQSQQPPDSTDPGCPFSPEESPAGTE